ncbi:MAG: hypothetical protein V8Q85_05860 [Christensenellales bacterium]
MIGKGAQALKGEEFRAYIGMVIADLYDALDILPLYGNSFLPKPCTKAFSRFQA